MTPDTRPPQPDFRPDINGLRAWAVVAVVLFHFDVPGFEGGFVGVDVFFVISGYLMTRIISTRLQQQRFNYLEFCVARAARILPALLVVCAVLMALGYFGLTPQDYRTLATHALSSVLFFSNIKYWDEAGYFDAASHEKWLLHTWSLSVEWQFYLFIPLVLWLVWNQFPRVTALRNFTVAAGLVFFALGLWATSNAPTSAFYLLPYRAWEFLVGGWVYLQLEPWVQGSSRWSRYRPALAFFGLAFIAASVGVFDASTPWPGWSAALPVLGAALVIAAGRPSWFTHNPALDWLGERSYSIYLWHWPVYVVAHFAGIAKENGVVLWMTAATLVLAELSYRLVEQPARKRIGRLSNVRGASVVATATLALTAGAMAVRMHEGFPGRLPPAAELAERSATDMNLKGKGCLLAKGVVSPECRWGGASDAEPSVVVIGDSHSHVLVSAVGKALEQTNALAQGPALQWSYAACPFLIHSDSAPFAVAERGPEFRCGDFVKWAIAQEQKLAPTTQVLIINRYASLMYGDAGDEVSFRGATTPVRGRIPRNESEAIAQYTEAIVDTACHFSQKHRVLLMRPIPEMASNVPKTMARRITMGLDPDVSVSREIYEQRNAWVWRAQDKAAQKCGAVIVDPTSVLCDADRCHGSLDGKPLYFDDDHLSESGNKVLVGLFKEALNPASARPAPEPPHK